MAGAAAPAADERHDGDGPYPLEGLKVLVVEDDPGTRELLAAILAQHGAEATTAANARDGLAAVRQRPPDVMVCDIAMPEIDGYHFVAAVKQWAASTGTRIPAVALTAYARQEDRDRAIAAGFDLHLTKPVEPVAIIAAVARLGARGES